ncbi:sigma 54-interacting transcriptional regulator [Clostridium sp.]
MVSIISIEKINEVLGSEDNKNPFSDEKIASIIGTNREKVTEIRIKNNIQDSRERRKQFILIDGEKIIKADIEVSDRNFTKQLNEMGYKLSRFVASKIKHELLNEIKIVPNCKIKNNGNGNLSMNVKENSFEKDELISSKEEYSFDNIIGSKGSLKVQISQAKAAILYPPNGLHTLVLGPSGVGKSHIVGEMYKFAAKSGNFKKDAPFIVFNCADYADNPQLLLSQLFGHVKGAFTGADSAKQGLVEKADGGILFIDEVHRLPSKGQEILFYLLDKGMYRRLGETESNRKANIMLIGATTEDPASYLLLTFRRRIPMVIEIPAINERPFSERYEIIKEFYLDESFRIGKTIAIDPEAIRALMLYDCPGNIGQLRSDIQVACARGFLTSRVNRDKTIQIGVCDLPNYVRNGLFIVDKKEEDADRFLNYSLIVNPNRSVVSTDRDDRYVFTDKIYQFIEERFNDLEKKGLTQEEINNIIGKQVEVEIKRAARDVNSCTSISKINLKEIVGEKILAATYSAIEIAKDNLNNLHENLYYSLAIHLSATYERLKSGKMIINPQLKTVIQEYPLEYKIAKVISKSLEKSLEIEIPEDEIAFIAMYLRTFSRNKEQEEGKVGVLVLSHGHVGLGMANVANRLLGVNHAVGLEMDLNESSSTVIDKAIEIVKRIDEGKGCIILADMGSLVGLGEIITKTTGIPTKTIGRVDTLMVLEAVRRATIPTNSLKEIAGALTEDKIYGSSNDNIICANVLQKVILTICISGEGTAIKVKKYIEELLEEVKEEITVIALGILKQKNIEVEINNIKKNNNVVAFVGTINPKVDNIPFISVEDIVNRNGKDKIFRAIGIEAKADNLLKDIINQDIIICDLEAKSKSDAIDALVELLEKQGYVDKEFMLSVYKRETMGATVLKNGIAIPHGEVSHVTKPAIAIAKLSKAIAWEGNIEADIVFMIALKEDSKIYFNDLYKIISSEDGRKAIRTAKNPEEIMNAIARFTIVTM